MSQYFYPEAGYSSRFPRILPGVLWLINKGYFSIFWYKITAHKYENTINFTVHSVLSNSLREILPVNSNP